MAKPIPGNHIKFPEKDQNRIDVLFGIKDHRPICKVGPLLPELLVRMEAAFRTYEQKERIAQNYRGIDNPYHSSFARNDVVQAERVLQALGREAARLAGECACANSNSDEEPDSPQAQPAAT